MHPKKKIQAFRLWDKKTPYSIHPIWCAMTILTETTLDSKIRVDGWHTLLYHDILEDTTKNLPSTLNQNIRHYIADMTFHGGIDEEIEKIWTKPKCIRLYKLYDKTSNLLDSTWMSPELYARYSKYTQKLLTDVEKNYGPLNIVRIAQAVCTMI